MAIWVVHNGMLRVFTCQLTDSNLAQFSLFRDFGAAWAEAVGSTSGNGPRRSKQVKAPVTSKSSS